MRFWCRWKRSGPEFATTAMKAVSSGAWKTANGKCSKSGVTIPTKSTGVTHEVEARNSEREPGDRHHRSVPAGRLFDHHQQPVLFSRDRRSGDRVHADPRAGNG